MICKKGKQSKYPIHKIIIIKCLIYEKMVKGNDDHYYLSAREIDLTILIIYHSRISSIQNHRFN